MEEDVYLRQGASPYIQMFSNLDRLLGLFPQLNAGDSFKSKLKNFSAHSLSATLSELSIANAFKSLGYKIEFETTFKQVNTGNNRDIDVSVYDNFGNVLHIEVYMPNNQNVVNGFTDMNESDADFKFKINRKLDKKFGVDGITDLNGRVLLAINIAYFDLLLAKSALPFFSNNDLYFGMKNRVPDGIDGLLFFRDGFTTDIPFNFEQLVLNNH